MAPHLVRAHSTYNDIWICSFHHTLPPPMHTLQIHALLVMGWHNEKEKMRLTHTLQIHALLVMGWHNEREKTNTHTTDQYAEDRILMSWTENKDEQLLHLRHSPLFCFGLLCGCGGRMRTVFLGAGLVGTSATFCATEGESREAEVTSATSSSSESSCVSKHTHTSHALWFQSLRHAAVMYKSIKYQVPSVTHLNNMYRPVTWVISRQACRPTAVRVIRHEVINQTVKDRRWNRQLNTDTETVIHRQRQLNTDTETVKHRHWNSSTQTQKQSVKV